MAQMYLCQKCQKRVRVRQEVKKDKKTGKKYLITTCLSCKGGLDIEDAPKK